jgi:hypothetical protein
MGGYDLLGMLVHSMTPQLRCHTHSQPILVYFLLAATHNAKVLYVQTKGVTVTFKQFLMKLIKVFCYYLKYFYHCTFFCHRHWLSCVHGGAQLSRRLYLLSTREPMGRRRCGRPHLPPISAADLKETIGRLAIRRHTSKGDMAADVWYAGAAGAKTSSPESLAIDAKYISVWRAKIEAARVGSAGTP